MGPRAGLERCGKSPPLGFDPRMVQSVVAIPTTLPRPTVIAGLYIYKGKGKGKGHPCTGTEALYRMYAP